MMRQPRLSSPLSLHAFLNNLRRGYCFGHATTKEKVDVSVLVKPAGSRDSDLYSLSFALCLWHRLALKNIVQRFESFR